jgi:DNA-binding GntR family transcriptional regulator
VNDTFRLETVKRENLGESVYARLSEALVQGRFPPDHRFTIRELADSLGTSVTPVRDALLRLSQDGALEQRSPRDLRVPILSVARYEEITAIRIRLEGLAARECALQAGPEDVARLERVDRDKAAALAAGAWPEAIMANQQFHFALAEIGRMEVLRATLQRLWLQMGPLIAAYYQAGGGLRDDRHKDILAAVRAKDAEAAERAIALDITAAGRTIREQIARLQGKGASE